MEFKRPKAMIEFKSLHMTKPKLWRALALVWGLVWGLPAQACDISEDAGVESLFVGASGTVCDGLLVISQAVFDAVGSKYRGNASDASMSVQDGDDTYAVDFNGVTYTPSMWYTGNITNMRGYFYSPSSRETTSISMSNTDISGWDTSNVTDMFAMFYKSPDFNQDLDTWNVSSVTNMSYMFFEATVFNGSLNWGQDTSNVLDMGQMFYGAPAFQGEGLSDWNTSSVTSMEEMFRDATAFNEGIGSWDVGSVTTMAYMFDDAQAFNTDLTGWAPRNVTDMSFMFADATAFNGNMSAWAGNLEALTTMERMFHNATAFEGDGLSGWNTPNVSSMFYTFAETPNFDGNIGSWDVSSVETMTGLFYGATAFNRGLNSWDTSKVTSLNHTFADASLFNGNIGDWDTSSVTDMTGTFEGAAAFNTDIGGWNVSGVTSMETMFQAAAAFNQDLTGWAVGNIAETPTNFNTDANPAWVDLPIWGTDSTAPVVIALIPDTNETDVDSQASLILEFNENVEVSDPSGQLNIFDSSGGFFEGALMSSSGFSFEGNRVSFKTVFDFEFGTEYYVLITSNAIQDISPTGNGFQGFSNPDSWKFTIEEGVSSDNSSVSIYLSDEVVETDDVLFVGDEPTVRVTLRDSANTLLPGRGSELSATATNGVEVGSFTETSNGGIYEATLTSDAAVTTTVSVDADGTALGEASATFNPIEAPGAPTGLSVDPSANALDLEWEAPAYDGGAALETYGYSLNGGSVVTTGSTFITHTITGIAAGQAYEVTVSAKNAGGWSDPSTAIRVPSVELATTAPATVNAPFSVTAEFSESVAGFDDNDIKLDNASLSNFDGSGKTYTFVVTPDGMGDLTVDVAAGAAVGTDANVTGNTKAEQLVRAADLTAPEVKLTTNASIPVNAAFEVVAEFSEPVVEFNADNITLSAGSNISVDPAPVSQDDTNTQYTFWVEPPAGTDADVTVDIEADEVQDAAGNGNIAAPQLSVEADLVAPTVLELSSTSSQMVSGAFDVTVRFSEQVEDFDKADITFGGDGEEAPYGSVEEGTFGSSSDGTTYSFTAVPERDGLISISISANVAADTAGNLNEATAQALERTVDTQNPEPSLALAAGYSQPVNGDFVLDLSFNETVTDFDETFVTPTNATIAVSPTNTDGLYQISVTPNANTDDFVDVKVNEGAAKDLAGNDSLEVAIQITADLVRPGVTLSAGNEDDNATTLVGESFEVTANFTEAVTLVAQDAVASVDKGTVEDGSWSNSNMTYTFTVKPSADADGDRVTVNLAAGVAQDEAGNLNTAAGQLQRTVDLSGPGLTLRRETAEWEKVNSAFTVLAEFDDEVSWSNPKEDIGVEGGTLDEDSVTLSSDPGDPSVYSFIVDPSDSVNTVTVKVATNVAFDSVNNGNDAAELSLGVDKVAPGLTLALRSDYADPVGGDFHVTATFDEAVTDFKWDDISPTNGTIVGEVTSTDEAGKTYEFKVTPSVKSGDVTISVADKAAYDSAGNGSKDASLTVGANLAETTVTLTSPAQESGYVIGTFEVTAQFSDTVTGFDADDIVLSSNAELDATNFASSGTAFTFDVTPKPESDGQTITVDIEAGAASDSALKATTAAETLELVADLTKPEPKLTVVDEAQAGDPVGESFQVQIDFGETVTGFDDLINDVGVTNATLGDTIAPGTEDGVYTFTVFPDSDGVEVTVEVPAGAATDQAGNPSLASDALKRTPDLKRPMVDLTMADAAASTIYVTGSFDVKVEFSEVVTGFTQEGIDLGDNLRLETGTFAQDAANQNIYTFTATPLKDGPVKINILEGAAEDSVGNPNEDAVQPLEREADLTAPSFVNFSTDALNPVGPGGFTVTVEFSELVTGFDDPDKDVTVSGGAVDSNSFTEQTGGILYTFDVIPSASAVEVSIAAGVAADQAGNLSPAVGPLTRTADLSAPSITEFKTDGDGPFKGEFKLLIEFSEDVFSFDDGDVTLSAGQATLGTITGDKASYSLLVDPTSTGDTTLTFDIGAGVANDGAGNSNTAAQSLSVEIDKTAPGIKLETEDSETGDRKTGNTGLTIGNSSFKVIATVTEAVDGFDIDHVSVQNGTLSDALIQSSSNSNEYSFEVTPDATGEVWVWVEENNFADAAGNLNKESDETLVVEAKISTFDVTLALDPAVIGTVTDEFTVTATFAEALSEGFDSTDHIDVFLGVVDTPPVEISATQYEFVVRPTGDGEVEVYVKDGVATDALGNKNARSTNTLSVPADISAPTVEELSTDVVQPVTGSFLVTAKFSEAVNEFFGDSTDIRVDNGAVASFDQTGDRSFEFTVDPAADGDVTIEILAAAATDDAGNLSEASAPLIVLFETPKAGVEISDLDLTLTEGTDQNVSLVLTTQPSANVTLVFEPDQSDLISLDTQTLIFDVANWSEPQDLWITAVDNTQFGDSQTYLTVSTTSDDSAYAGLSAQTIDIAIADNNKAAFVINPSPAQVMEAGSGTFTVSLETQPVATVDLVFGSNNTSMLTVNEPGTLSFAPEIWDIPQTVTLTAANNHILGDTEGSINIVASGSENYEGVSANLSVLIIDDDRPPPPEDSGAIVSSLATSEVMANQLGSVLSDAIAGGLSQPQSRNSAPTRLRRSMFGLSAGEVDPDAYDRLYVLSAREGEEGFTLVDWFSLGLSQTTLDAELSGKGTFAYAMLGAELSKTETSVGGLLYGAETSSWDYDEETDVDRTGFSIGYYNAQVRDGLTYSGSAVATFTHNRFVNTLNATGDAGSRRLILKGSVSGEALRDEIDGNLRGYIDLMYATETLNAFTFSNGTTSAQSTTNIGRVGVGLEYTTVPDADGGRFLVRGELSQVFGADDVTLSDGEVYSPNQSAVGAVTFGWITRPNADTSAQVEVTFGELGNDEKQEIRLDGNVDRKF